MASTIKHLVLEDGHYSSEFFDVLKELSCLNELIISIRIDFPYLVQ